MVRKGQRVPAWLVAMVVGGLAAMSPTGTDAQSIAADEIVVVTAAEDAEGATESDFTIPMLAALEKHAVEGITRKANAALVAQGISQKFPPLKPSSTYTTIGGKKLAIVKLRNDYANQVVVHGIVGSEFRRVVCARTRGFELDLPVFYGSCGETVRKTFELKGLPGDGSRR